MSRRAPLLALVGVTAIWGVTFVQVQDAIALYPLFAFLAVRFAISTVVLAPFAWSSLRTLPRSGYVAGIGVGVLLATAYGLQTAGLELTTVASTGFITGLYVVFTPLLALAFFGTPVPRVLWAGVALAVVGLLLLNGVPGGSALGNALVLANAVFQALQITAMERFAPRYDPRALTFLMMATSFVGFTVIALALGELEVPRGATVWGALVVTGVFAGALGYLIATWVQGRTTAARAALVFTLEAPFAALAGVLLANEVLGWIGWLGCAVMMAGILVAEPAAAATLRRLVAPRAACVVDGVLLAVASRRSLFGAMTVLRSRRARHGRALPAAGTFLTVARLRGAVTGIAAAARGELGRRGGVAVPPRGPARAGHRADSSSRSPCATPEPRARR